MRRTSQKVYAELNPGDMISVFSIGLCFIRMF